MQVWLTDVHPSPHRGMLTHTYIYIHTRRRQSHSDTGIHKTLISNIESSVERELLCEGEEREKNNNKKGEKDRRTDRGQGTLFSQLKCKWKMALREEEEGCESCFVSWEVNKCWKASWKRSQRAWSMPFGINSPIIMAEL